MFSTTAACGGTGRTGGDGADVMYAGATGAEIGGSGTGFGVSTHAAVAGAWRRLSVGSAIEGAS